MKFESKVLPAIGIKINGKIKKAMDSYKQKKIPMRVMLTDFLAVKSHGDELAEADNPWAYNYKGIEGYEIESGVSLDESAFRFAAMTLKNEKPSDVINAAFYSNKIRNDSDFELGYLLPLFIDAVESQDKALVVNPSPDIICAIEEKGCCKERFYAVTDKTIAALYRFQFPDAGFYTFDQMQGITNIDKVLITNRDQKADQTQVLLKCLTCCNSKAKIIGLIPCAWFDNHYSEASVTLSQSHFIVRQILVVAPKATASSPRKKMIVVMEEGTTETIEVFNSSYDEKQKQFSVSENVICINADLYLKTNRTILSIINSEKKLQIEKKENEYRKAKEYKFSNEISLFYKIYSDRKNKYAGVVYFREIKSTTLKIWGRKISPDIEKGLRSETREGVIDSLQKTVFDENLYTIIRTDVQEKYMTMNIPVTLKTLWFCCWIFLSDMKKYDHEYVFSLFQQSTLSDIIPQYHKGSDILGAIAERLNVDTDEIPYKAVEQIDLVLSTAVKHGMLLIDPLESFVNAYSRRASERQQDVRNALVKKHFSSEEEYKIFKEIVKKINVSGDNIFACTKKSLLLSVAIRLFTGMAIREVAALTWADFRRIEGTDDYQFTITKFVDSKGKVMRHSNRENWKRFRIIPSSRTLTYLINERRQYLLDNGVDKEYLMGYPIILQDERLADMRNRKSVGHCKPEKISGICNELINMAGIPVNEVVLPDAKSDLVTDFNRYHGDIFLSNFRHKAKHDAFMTLDEINYMIGVNAPDTFSRYYCDESNDFVQVGIIQKLCRWESIYSSLIRKQVRRTPGFGTAKGSKKIVTGPFPKGVAVLDLLIDNSDDQCVKVSAKCPNGIYVNKTVYYGEDNAQDFD